MRILIKLSHLSQVAVIQRKRKILAHTITVIRWWWRDVMTASSSFDCNIN